MPYKYKRVYEMLKRYGHAPCKAAEIIVDARRKDTFALTWVKIVYQQRHR